MLQIKVLSKQRLMSWKWSLNGINLHEVEQQTEASVVIWCRRRVQDFYDGCYLERLSGCCKAGTFKPKFKERAKCNDRKKKFIQTCLNTRRWKHIKSKKDLNARELPAAVTRTPPRGNLQAWLFQTCFFMHAVPESWYYEGLSLIQRKHLRSGSVQYICSISLPVDD